MKYSLLTNTAALYHADCRDALRLLPDNCLDSCVTDPPYALVSTLKRFANSPRTEASMPTAGPYARASRGFMGQKWDTGETAFSAEFWFEVLRVLKPGAFVAAFGASRGYHRMACAIEDAGFDVRDSLMWVYATGFPKSHDVSKGIDDHMFGQWLDADPARREAYMTEMRAARATVGDEVVRKRAVDAVDRKWREASGCARELMAPKDQIAWQRNIGNVRPYMLDPEHQTVSDEPATPEAAEWEGWGTALKPAFEPIVLARKPLSEGTVAANVLRWRTGALNIGATRIPSSAADQAYMMERVGGFNNTRSIGGDGILGGGETMDRTAFDPSKGRWPANVVHDGSDEVVGAFPQSAGAQGSVTGDEPSECHNGVYSGPRKRVAMAKRGDSGSAARFFYSAKASKADRNGSKHPTVKPIALMQWLARLITPPGGTVLDPFAGSGTTGAACAAEGFNVVLVEREAEYVEDIKRRFVPASEQNNIVVSAESS